MKGKTGETPWGDGRVFTANMSGRGVCPLRDKRSRFFLEKREMQAQGKWEKMPERASAAGTLTTEVNVKEVAAISSSVGGGTAGGHQCQKAIFSVREGTQERTGVYRGKEGTG